MKICKLLLYALPLALLAACGSKVAPDKDITPVIRLTLAGVSYDSVEIGIESLDCEYVTMCICRADETAPAPEAILASGEHIDGKTYSRSGLEENTAYCAYAVPVGERGITGSMEKLDFSTTGKPVPGKDPSALRVVRNAENLYISSRLDDSSDIVYHFRKCMFNELYTFYSVGSASRTAGEERVNPATASVTIFNQTGSDNIGPFAINGHGFVGGNHDNSGNKTAKTTSWTVTADGAEVPSGADLPAAEICISVDNDIYASDGTTLIKEHISYSVDGPALKVQAAHKFLSTITVAKYYGMQSMFIGETRILAPGTSGFGTWRSCPASVTEWEERNTKDVGLYIERKGSGIFQSAYLYPTGLGNHSLVSNGPSYLWYNYSSSSTDGKSYHCLIWNSSMSAGSNTTWEGVYSWGQTTLADDSTLFCYETRHEGKRAVYICALQACERTLSVSGVSEGSEASIADVRGGLSATACEGGLAVKATAPGWAIVTLQ